MSTWHDSHSVARPSASRKTAAAAWAQWTAFWAAVVLLLAIIISPAAGQVPDLAAGRVPTLAPLVREVTPAVVNISVQGKVHEDNPLYKAPVFREFFDLPKQLEKEVSATGSGVTVDAERGYVLTANHV